jgi:hypothetical protein
MIKTLIKTHQTVFSFAELQSIFPDQKTESLKQTLRRYKKDGKLLNPQKGVWTLPVYDSKELAGKLFPGGYISLEKVLFEAGVSFQRYGNTVHCIRHKSADITFNNENYVARSMKPSIYNNRTCIQEFPGYRKAMPERALCDLVYFRPTANFDNPQYFQTKQSETRLKMLFPLYPKTTQDNVRRIIAQQI